MGSFITLCQPSICSGRLLSHSQATSSPHPVASQWAASPAVAICRRTGQLRACWQILGLLCAMRVHKVWCVSVCLICGLRSACLAGRCGFVQSLWRLCSAASSGTPQLCALQARKAGEANEEDFLRLAAEDAELSRARERLTLKHRNSSRWARRALRRGVDVMDPGTKAALEEQLRLGEQLRRKVGRGPTAEPVHQASKHSRTT